MRTPKSLRTLAAARRQVARMNEMGRVIRAELDSPTTEKFFHPDTESMVERAYQNQPDELHIGFRA